MSGHSPLRQPIGPPEASSAALLVDVVVLSNDPTLFEATRAAVGERNPVWRARSAAESVDLLLSGRCGVLLLDLAAVSAEPASLIEQIVEQFPDVIVIVAGRREDEARLVGLLSEGHVYRFMHKPLTPKRAGMFLNAAIRSHAERRGIRAPGPARLATGPAISWPSLRRWSLIAAGLACLLLVLSIVLVDHGAPATKTRPGIQSAPVVPSGPAAGPRADPVLSRARAAYASGRYEAPPGRNALDLYAAVLLARPGHAEARAGLESTLAKIVEAAEREATAGRRAEAYRLLQRVTAADPGHSAAAELLARLAPRPSPPERSPVAAPPPAAARVAKRADRPATTPGSDAARPPAKSLPVRRTVVQPDPLTPRIVNADALRRAQRSAQAARSYGAPIPSDPPIAGLADPTPGMAPAPGTPPGAGTSDATAPAAQPAFPLGEFRPLVIVDPVYPPEALRSRTEGWVELEFTITETGSVRDAAVVGAEPQGTFDAAALAALGRWRFEPRIANGRPVAHRSIVTLRFDVDD